MLVLADLNQIVWVWQAPNARYLLTVVDQLPSTPLMLWVR